MSGAGFATREITKSYCVSCQIGSFKSAYFRADTSMFVSLPPFNSTKETLDCLCGKQKQENTISSFCRKILCNQQERKKKRTRWRVKQFQTDNLAYLLEYLPWCTRTLCQKRSVETEDGRKTTSSLTYEETK